MTLLLVLRVSSIFCALALRPHHDPETDIPDPVLKPENQETGLEKSAELAEANETDNTDKTDKTMATNATNGTNGTNGTQTEQHPNLADMPMPNLIDRLQEDKYSWAHVATALIMVACSAVMFVSGDLFACLKAPAASEQQKTVEDGEEADEEDGEADTRGTQMLPAEEKSDQPVRWFTKALRKGKLSAECGCLTLRFENEYTEKVWTLDSLPKNMQRGAALMAGMAIGLLANRVFYFYEYFTCEDLHDQKYEGYYSLNVDLCFSLCLLGVMAASLLLTWTLGDSKPRQELSTAHVASYWCLMLFLWGAFLATTVPPLKMTCEQLEDVGGIIPGSQSICEGLWRIPALKLDCTLQGHTACQIFMLFLLSLPFALPQLYHQYLALVWLLIYGGATYAYGALNHLGIEAEKRQNKDMMLHLSLLILALGIGYSRKFSLEKSMRKHFVCQLKQRQAMAPLYLMFKEMVPEYVIPRMLNKEVIADPRSTVTVLFVLIDNFGDYTREKQNPQSSLKFLNACFDKMDTICAKYKVTKIETVQEEYVACVGVTMEEQNIDHKVLLSKLLKAAAEILAVKEVEVEGGQKVAVSFKMGMHTGSIVAGVIGSKLPRFRLFGDTINTSARMMQKGQPGTVQFGEATMNYVDADKVVDNSTRPNNGIVTMKGKGDVQTWVLNTKVAAEEGGVKPDEKRKSVLSQMVMGQSVEETHDDEFDQMMDKQLAEDESAFSAKEEAAWLCWFHENNMGAFALRMNFLTFVFSCVTLVEVFHMEHIRAFSELSNSSLEKAAMKHDVLGKVPPKWRLFSFLFFRLAAFLICLVWSILANSGSLWLRPPVPDFGKLNRRQCVEAGRQRRQVQVALVVSKAVICILVWLSYNVLILERRHQSYSTMHRLDYYNQQFSLVFMMAFFVIINGQVVLGFSSLTFVVLAIAFMAIEDRTPLYVSMTGRVVFVGVAILGSILAYEGERTSRASFRSKVKVEKTESRIEDVLTTLMPKEVLKEWRANPGTHPVHVYKHATVTQSDLCGFTQLSSGRSPFEVVSFMGELFGRFDVLAQEFNIYKVETVGDAYIAGMAEPYLTDQHSAVRVVEFGLAMIKATAKWSERLRQRGEAYKDANVRCRVGVHHGECVGGIVGTGMMRYHLFGEFMSIVDILEATSKEGVCQISDACRKQIESEGGFSNSIQFEERKDELKTSKGEVHGTDEVGGTTFLVYPVITEDRVRNFEEDEFWRGLVFIYRMLPLLGKYIAVHFVVATLAFWPLLSHILINFYMWHSWCYIEDLNKSCSECCVPMAAATEVGIEQERIILNSWMVYFQEKANVCFFIGLVIAGSWGAFYFHLVRDRVEGDWYADWVVRNPLFLWGRTWLEVSVLGWISSVAFGSVPEWVAAFRIMFTLQFHHVVAGMVGRKDEDDAIE